MTSSDQTREQRLAEIRGLPYHAEVHLLEKARMDLLAEVDRLNVELKIAFSPSLYLEIQQVLDDALGTNESDGAGVGIVADIALVAERMQAAEAEVERLRAQVELLGSHLQLGALDVTDELRRSAAEPETDDGELP